MVRLYGGGSTPMISTEYMLLLMALFQEASGCLYPLTFADKYHIHFA